MLICTVTILLLPEMSDLFAIYIYIAQFYHYFTLQDRFLMAVVIRMATFCVLLSDTSQSLNAGKIIKCSE